MIIYTITKAVRDNVTAVLRLHHDDPRMAGGFKVKVRRDELPGSLAAVVDAWPAEQDGTYKIALSEVAGALVWRAYAIAEIAAGRGKLAAVDEYGKRLGVAHFDTAFAYVCDQMRGHGIRPCSDADRDCWSEATHWVTRDGYTVEPRGRWARSTWARRAIAHEAFAAAGLARPGRNTWHPEATMLFVAPRPERQPASTTLTEEEDAALASLAVF
ncbi:hypothetical protein SAMN05216338_1001857 [Bradyrhizobium sp. Rc2d]|uniref:hypothetical protein n=1 Tax=Bradyrhizobium sp. Rc2d TaxID=1855321 RepID=UPI00088647A2|nr:hypothetical protein [Bradyrhizobium sp. Rc2d]SDG59782.1 hypothetical protein SAMN05216338_1001857 [Bradyrhizobium sp. Rc2d]